MRRLLVVGGIAASDPGAGEGGSGTLDLYKALSVEAEVTLLTSVPDGAPHGDILHAPTLREVRFPEDAPWRRARGALERRGLAGAVSGLAFALANSDPACRMRQAARSLAPAVDAIVHASPYSEPMFADGRFADKEFYLAPQFELNRFAAAAHGAGLETGLLKVMRLEGNLVARARKVFAASPDAAERFRLFYGVPGAKLDLCPSGFWPPAPAAPGPRGRAAREDAAGRRPRLLFMGSAHPSDIEAATSLLDIAPRIAACDIVIAGGASASLSGADLPSNVEVVAVPDAGTSLRLLREADIVLDPAGARAGPRSGALEALGAGLPLVITPEGARDLALVDGRQARVAPRDDFPEAIAALVADEGTRRRLADAGRAHVEARYTWTAIAETFAAALGREPAAAAPGRPLYLALNDYPVLDALSGGKSRIRNLLGRLEGDVVLLSFGPVFEAAGIAPGFLQVSVPRTRDHQAFEAAANEGEALSVNDCVATLFVAANRVLRALATRIAARAAAVIFEHPYMAPLLDALAAVRADLPVVYSAHNVEAEHRTGMVAAHASAQAFDGLVRDLEGLLTRRADLVACCTEADARHFAEAGAETLVVPNGCAVPSRDALALARSGMPLGRPKVGFLGSSHGPNVEAAAFILREIAPAFPTVDFELVGTVCAEMTGDVPPNVALRGAVDERRKTRILADWTIALNPLASGGGSSLKLPDCMAHELATLNTPLGARGFAIAEHDAGAVVERGDVAKTLAAMLADRTRLQSQRRNAYAYASEELDWANLAQPYAERLAHLAAPPRPTPPRRLLVVTDRYDEPAAGAAGRYLPDVLDALRERFARIDLAALDGGEVDDTGGGGRIGETFDEALFFPPDAAGAADIVARRLIARAGAEAEFDLRLPFAASLAQDGAPRPLSGFFAPEARDGRTRRWTAPGFALLLPAGSEVLTLRGDAERDTHIDLATVRVGPGAEPATPATLATHRQTIGGAFALHVALPDAGRREPIVIRCAVEQHTEAGDDRPLGLLMDDAGVLLGDRQGGPDAPGDAGGLRSLVARAFDLDEDIEAVLREREPARWAAARRDAARRCAPEVEAAIAAVTGPRSRDLLEWLAGHGGSYDVALVTGPACAVVADAVGTLAKASPRPRIVVLPRPRADEPPTGRARDAFEAADATLLSSSASVGQWDVPDGVAIVPGIGVDLRERADLGAVDRFRELHPDPSPFFLLVEAEGDAAGQARVFRACEALRRDGVAPLGFVRIGQGTGLAVPSVPPGVHDLGRPPREIVRGALTACVGCVAMGVREDIGPILCDAWLFGKPVIADRRNPWAREWLVEGETGLLVETDGEFEAAMRKLRDDPALGRRLGANGFRHVAARHSWEHVAGVLRTHL